MSAHPQKNRGVLIRVVIIVIRIGISRLLQPPEERKKKGPSGWHCMKYSLFHRDLPIMAYICPYHYNSYITWVVFHPLHTNHHCFGSPKHLSKKPFGHFPRVLPAESVFPTRALASKRVLPISSLPAPRRIWNLIWNLIWKSHERYPGPWN